MRISLGISYTGISPAIIVSTWAQKQPVGATTARSGHSFPAASDTAARAQGGAAARPLRRAVRRTVGVAGLATAMAAHDPDAGPTPDTVAG